ncbi:hypothetical protein CVIRNUC_002378 [Coccomyxa viridis]|uniref:Pentatricopeptide repeat-containing protein-mitochondrial domain-containing protein n=1 Tax=Coccomyxa viridis TaxID=1274662 RepID=A0AAV1HVQ8_9CHLO|nr:hypothetical protein CVIRNUC_002378 [Coccomyxa viridis]
MPRHRLVFGLASALRRQGELRHDGGALASEIYARWALQAARHISWPAASDEQIVQEEAQQLPAGDAFTSRVEGSYGASTSQPAAGAGQRVRARPAARRSTEGAVSTSSVRELQLRLRASAVNGHGPRRGEIARLPLPKTGAALVPVMAGVSDIVKDRGSPGMATPYWLYFERYLDFLRQHRAANAGKIDDVLMPPDLAINAYFMALAADVVPYTKAFNALRAVEIEFDRTLTNFAYQAVLRICASDNSEPSARMALRILDGLRERRTGITEHVLNLVATACKEAELLDEALRVLHEIHETFPGQLSQHSEQTHGNVTWLAIAKGRMEDVMRLLDQAAACGWTPRPALLSRCLVEVMDTQLSPDMALRILNFNRIPEGLEQRPEAPYIEEGLCTAVMNFAAVKGHTELALKAWECMEYAILPAAPFPSDAASSPAAEPASNSAQAARNEDLHKPAVVAFQAMIDTFVRARQLKEAFRLVCQLQMVYPDQAEAVDYSRALAQLVDAIAESASEVDNAYYLLEEMHAQGEPLCPAMLDCVVAACSQIGDSSRAFETFAAYGNLGLTPGAQAYNAVLQGCIYHGLIDSVPKILEDMKAAEVGFNALTHSLMVESFVVQNQPQAAVDAYFEAQAANKAIRPETFEKMVARCERGGNVDLMEELYNSRQYQGRDTSFDMVKMLRWRWGELGGIERLAEAPDYRPRPMLPGSHNERRRTELQRKDQRGMQPAAQQSRQRQRSSSTPPPQEQVNVPLAEAKFEPLPLDW